MDSAINIDLNARQTFVIAGASATLYFKLVYLTDRADFLPIIAAYIALFILFFLLTGSRQPIRQLFALGLLLRFVTFFALPGLSDDFYRFYWDGLLSLNGVNPFHLLPSDIIDNSDLIIPGIDQGLFSKLNSPDYYTVYPPFCQLVFLLSAWLSAGNLEAGVLVMRLMVLVAEAGSGLIMISLLKKMGLPEKNFLYYWFNPLVIIELTGNLHPEVFMIFFLLMSVWYLLRKREVHAALFFALAIASKLLPLMLLPLFLKRLGLRRAALFYVMVAVFTLLMFVPLLSNAFIHGFFSSISLYFQKFEFNASIYYLVREAGFWVTGWNIIGIAGKWLAAATLILILAFTFFEKVRTNSLPGVFIWPLFIYFALATTVHPWYVVPVVAFSIFTGFRFPLLWSFMIFWSYEGYSSHGFSENMLVVWLEYLLMYGFAAYEIYATGRFEWPTNWRKDLMIGNDDALL